MGFAFCFVSFCTSDTTTSNANNQSYLFDVDFWYLNTGRLPDARYTVDATSVGNVS